MAATSTSSSIPAPLFLKNTYVSADNIDSSSVRAPQPRAGWATASTPSNIIQTSPLSPTFVNSRGNARSRRTTPPPLHAQRDLEVFSEQCRAWYFDQNDEAGRVVAEMMSNVSSSQRAPYMKLQASIRAAYHNSVTSRRLAEFQAHLSSTSPGGSLSPQARADPRGAMAQKERFSRMQDFIRSWCSPSTPGTGPLFHGLWALFRLQTLPTQLGGAGSRLMDWELDDAVFREAAGRDFMLEAITVMKGVLGFSDLSQPSTETPSQSAIDLSTGSQRQMLDSRTVEEVPMGRLRALSDPFVDAEEPSPSSSHHGLLQATTPLYTPRVQMDEGFDRPDERQLRVWVAPDLSNPELASLVSLFPRSITTQSFPRFSVTRRKKARKKMDLEEALADGAADQLEQLRCGSGQMWIGLKERSGSWRGSLWARFISWLRTVLC